MSRLALTLRADLVAVETLASWRERDVRGILLRGPVIARALYDSEGERGYGDCDLLVAEASRDRAEAVLEARGFTRHPHDAQHSRHWLRDVDGAAVDVHVSLEGAQAPAALVWESLAAHAAPLELNGRRVEGLDAAGVAYVTALHAAQHGGMLPHPMEDLRRAVARIDEAAWREAAALAERTGAGAAFAEALALLDEAAPLRAALGLEAGASVEARLRAEGRDPAALAALRKAARTGGVTGRASALARLVVPPAWFMREHDPWASRGPLGLLAAYLRRPLRVVPRLLGEWRTVRRARSASG